MEGGKMRISYIILLGVVLSLGCARLRVEAPKEPIKVDITMRLDVYQHIIKDIDAIEDIVSGEGRERARPQSLLDSFVGYCYAEEGLNPEIEQAALRRKERYAQLSSLQQKGVVGENRNGLVEIRTPGQSSPQVDELIKLENNDRMIIYRLIAEKNRVSVEEIQKVYAKRLQNDAPPATPVEVLNEASGSYEWRVKNS
jgi:uncharacterized protein YdbL (DUF1318 family)